MCKFTFPFIIALLISHLSWAQEKSHEFSDELCLYKGTYDSTLYTETQLVDTYKLVQGYFSLYTDDEQQIDEIYQSMIEELKNLDLVKSDYFNNLRKSYLKYLQETYKVKKVEFAAKNGNAKALKKYYQKNPTVKYYSEALIKGGDELMKAYEHLTKEQMKNNAAPEVLWNEYLRHSKSADAHQYAFKRVLTYGWWNAINNHLPHVIVDGTQFEEYKKLFIKIDTEDCDEP